MSSASTPAHQMPAPARTPAERREQAERRMKAILSVAAEVGALDKEKKGAVELVRGQRR